jgi:hypothetical protein
MSKPAANAVAEKTLKLSSKNRYRATAAQVRLYGGKTITEFFVMWDPADASTWTTQFGYGKTPGERMTDARRRALAARAQ